MSLTILAQFVNVPIFTDILLFQTFPEAVHKHCEDVSRGVLYNFDKDIIVFLDEEVESIDGLTSLSKVLKIGKSRNPHGQKIALLRAAANEDIDFTKKMNLSIYMVFLGNPSEWDFHLSRYKMLHAVVIRRGWLSSSAATKAENMIRRADGRRIGAFRRGVPVRQYDIFPRAVSGVLS